jgi:hypothetical protein
MVVEQLVVENENLRRLLRIGDEVGEKEVEEVETRIKEREKVTKEEEEVNEEE